jgi:hypothetical protein
VKYADLKAMALEKPIIIDGITVVGSPGIYVRRLGFRKRFQPVVIRNTHFISRGLSLWEASVVAYQIFREAIKPVAPNGVDTEIPFDSVPVGHNFGET